MVGTIWALVPPIIAIGLALITKEVYLSLMVGIASGALMFEHFNPVEAMNTIFEIMTGKIGGNCDILIFLVMLGILVALITKSGASRAYGKWALKAITGHVCHVSSWNCDLRGRLFQLSDGWNRHEANHRQI